MPQHALTDPNILEQAAAAATIPASKVAGRFPYRGSNTGRSHTEIAEIHAKLSFGTIFTDHMAHVSYSVDDGWHNHGLIDYGDLQISPAAAVLHYGQEIFEGLKAYRHADGSLWTFRPGFNAARFNASAVRMAMPQIPVADFLASIVDLVRRDGAYVPAQVGAALYLRPFMFASEPFLGVRPAHHYEFLTIASPVGPYFTDGFTPVSIWVTRDFHRAGPGGTGAAKTGGNY
ncbi:MAG: branched chain amino acid aminotransferase, partial [Bowdeniella nasicola]|nr:branched chain amino acid aminotransferase [Bowdeniella nasicola]